MNGEYKRIRQDWKGISHRLEPCVRMKANKTINNTFLFLLQFWKYMWMCMHVCIYWGHIYLCGYAKTWGQRWCPTLLLAVLLPGDGVSHRTWSWPSGEQTPDPSQAHPRLFMWDLGIWSLFRLVQQAHFPVEPSPQPGNKLSHVLKSYSLWYNTNSIDTVFQVSRDTGRS